MRDHIVERLKLDLIGPLEADETLRSRPTDTYLTAILYPQFLNTPEDENDESESEQGGMEQAAGDHGVSLAASGRPAAAGLSCIVEHVPGTRALMEIVIEAGSYERVEPGGREEAAEHAAIGAPKWRRHPHRVEMFDFDPASGPRKIIKNDRGIHLDLTCIAKSLRPGLTAVTLALVNRAEGSPDRDENEERTLFQVRLEARVAGGGRFAALPGAAASADEDEAASRLIYRKYRQFAVGHTCSAEWSPVELPETVAMVWIPRVSVPALSESGDVEFQDMATGEDGRVLDPEWIANSKREHLLTGLRAFVGAYATWIDRRRGECAGLHEAWEVAQASKHLATCSAALDRMTTGIDLLDEDPHSLEAFRLANWAISKQRKWAEPGREFRWRPFQLGFQLLVLRSLARPDDAARETMDLLWFPTGGGKTEAYLGLVAFTLFLRRLNRDATGPPPGVDAFMRYTLRLLTVQQFERAVATTLACEFIRRTLAAKPDGQDLGATPFGIGLWIGSDTSPNLRAEAMLAGDEGGATAELLERCPACHNQLVWRKEAHECRPQCDAPGCELGALGRDLPVWTVDEDVYDRRPSLVISTTDKFAQVVRNVKTAAIFGSDGRSTKPSLILQDELHLISGPLGTLAALYEVAIDEICSAGGVRPKIVGSTATIRRAGDQISKLFRRATFQFPPPGIDVSNSGFAVHELSRPGRLYTGVTTAGRSPKYALQALAASLVQASETNAFPPEQKDWYWTIVGYFNSLRELGGLIVLFHDDVPQTMSAFARRHGEQRRRLNAPQEITSTTVTSRNLKPILRDLERPFTDPDCYDAVLASNMISVGIDISRLGLMLVNGQPKTMAEYIQATSRIGRRQVPGLVVTLFYNSRPRDRTRYESFSQWHRTLYQDVEATSVTPFAPRAADKGLHAIVVALARHLVAGLRDRPQLSAARAVELRRVATAIVRRCREIEPGEEDAITRGVEKTIAEWERVAGRLDEYWEDYGNRRSLLMSAEQFAAITGGGGATSAVWPAPNTMRDVEPGVQFVLASGLARREADE